MRFRERRTDRLTRAVAPLKRPRRRGLIPVSLQTCMERTRRNRSRGVVPTRTKAHVQISTRSLNLIRNLCALLTVQATLLERRGDFVRTVVPGMANGFAVLELRTRTIAEIDRDLLVRFAVSE